MFLHNDGAVWPKTYLNPLSSSKPLGTPFCGTTPFSCSFLFAVSYGDAGVFSFSFFSFGSFEVYNTRKTEIE